MNRLTQDILTSVTGNLPKAVLFVRRAAVLPGSTAAQAAKDAAALQKELLANTKAALNNPMAAATSLATVTAMAGLKGYLPMQVQYNPSALYLDTSSAGLREIDNSSVANLGTNQIAQITTPTITTLGMQLIFDDVNTQDAFMFDALDISAGGAMSHVMNLAREHSVKKYAEGLIACLMSPITRQIIFYWSDMVFRGELFQVNVNYTMFNRKGEPIRATVELTIQQTAETESTEKGGYWDTAFTRAFGEADENLDTGGASGVQKALNNNLLNLSI